MRNAIGRPGSWLFRQPLLLVCVAYFTWALNIVLGRFVAGHIPPVALAFFRWGFAVLVVLPFAWPYLKRDWPAIRKDMPLMIFLSMTGISAYNAMAYTGLQYTQAINSLLIQATAPLLIAAWTFLMFGDRLSLRQIIGIIVSAAGVVVILCRGDLDILHAIAFNRGDIWFFSALIIFALYSALLKKRPAIHPMSFLTFSMGFGAISLAPVMVWEMQTGYVMPLDMTALSMMIYVVIFPSILAYFCYNRAIEIAGPNWVGTLYPLIIIFGAGLAIPILGERPQLFHLVGCVLVISGTVIATLRVRDAPSSKVPSSKP